jgi:uncharacterized membrane protein YvbJ
MNYCVFCGEKISNLEGKECTHCGESFSGLITRIERDKKPTRYKSVISNILMLLGTAFIFIWMLAFLILQTIKAYDNIFNK